MKSKKSKFLLASVSVLAVSAGQVSGVRVSYEDPFFYYLSLLIDYICHYIWSDFYKKKAENTQKIEDFSKECSFSVHPVDRDSQDVRVITWPNNFLPKVLLKSEENQVNGEYAINKLKYNISTGELFVYSPDYENGKSPIKLEGNDVEVLLNNIKKQKRSFDFDIINKVKEQFSAKHKDIGWKYDENNRKYEGTFEVEGTKFTISLQSSKEGKWRNGERDEKYRCKIKIGDKNFLYCDAFNEEEEKKFTRLMSDLKFCIPKIKKLQETGDFEGREFPFGNFDLVPKKPFYIKYSDGDVTRYDHIEFHFSRKVVLYCRGGLVHNFELDNESKRKEFSKFVELLVNRKDEEKIIISDDEFASAPLPAPPEKYTRSFGELSPCNQENCNIQFKNGEQIND